MSMFKKATRKQLRLRLAIDGPAGSGKTFTGLRLAFALGQRVAAIDTERGSASKYAGEAPDGVPFNFDVLELDDHSPSNYTAAILAAGQAGYDALLIDSLSHAWAGQGGALDLHTKAADRERNSFTAWKNVTPMHNEMVEAILRSPCHVIATMRTKTEYVLEPNERGQMVPRKIGLAPIQRSGVEYEFDVVCDMDQDHVLRVSKSRCPQLSGKVAVKPGAPFFVPLATWLDGGEAAPADAYVATAEDLQKFAARTAAEAPPKSPQELARERRERRERKEASLPAQDAPPAADEKPEATSSPPPAPSASGEVASSSPDGPSDSPPETAAKRGRRSRAFQTSNNPDSASDYSYSLADPLRDEDRKKIFSLFTDLELSEDECRGVIQAQGVERLAQLTIGQAEQIIVGLEKELQEKRGEIPF